jgi:class 3 adenylate cyclase
MARAVEKSWSWVFAASPEALWPVLADTRRLNEASGFPRYTLEEKARPDGSVERIGHARRGPIKLDWTEGAFDFVTNQWFQQTRWFHQGPFASLTARMELTPEKGATRVVWREILEVKGPIGRTVAPIFLNRTGKAVKGPIEQAAAFVMGQSAEGYGHAEPELAAGGKERAAGIAEILADEGHNLAPRLTEHLLAASDTDVERVRPRTLARGWSAPDRPVIELCLAGAKRGLLDLRWDVLCPRCRGAKASTASLDQVPKGAHCPSCNIEYASDFTRNVEVTFRPAASIRRVISGGFCLSSPMATPHVAAQQRLEPGAKALLKARLPAGAYRVRTLEAGGQADLDLDGAFPVVVVDGTDVRLGGPADDGIIELRNNGKLARTVVIESREWLKDALTAHEVTTLQGFRDLFGAETLRPGDEVEINQVALMFTDIKGSTALYSRIGDAKAYAMVREHFAVLTHAVRVHDGAIVKTIGDAVMAAFADPADAVAAALDVQRDIAAFNRDAGDGSIIVKLGVHAGPCIAVTLNDRLDYFGTTVNMAARLQDRSEGDDIVLSSVLVEDPAVEPLLKGLPMKVEAAAFKGFDEAVRYYRLTSQALLQSRMAKPQEAPAL